MQRSAVSLLRIPAAVEAETNAIRQAFIPEARVSPLEGLREAGMRFDLDPQGTFDRRADDYVRGTST